MYVGTICQVMGALLLENHCRFCRKVFCCENCRLKHEEAVHNINPKCDICIYGHAFLRAPCESIITHWILQHWPLHCVLCKIVFTRQQDIVTHKKCCKNLHVIQNSSMHTSISDINYDSPPISSTTNFTKQVVVDTIASITTSTPMQQLVKSITMEITRVECSGNDVIVNSIASSTPVTEELANSESTKRKVTFCESPKIHHEMVWSPITGIIPEEKQPLDHSSVQDTVNVEVKLGISAQIKEEDITHEAFVTAFEDDIEKNLEQSDFVEATDATHLQENIVINAEADILNGKNKGNQIEKMNSIADQTPCSINIKQESLYNTANSTIDIFRTPEVDVQYRENKIEVVLDYQTPHAEYTAKIEKKLDLNDVQIKDIAISVHQNQCKQDLKTIEACDKSNQENTRKRLKPETELLTEETLVKRIKLIDIKCRRSIKCQRCPHLNKLAFDKWTQTD